MKQVALEERAGLGLTCYDRLDPYLLAHEHRIAIYPIDELPDEYCSHEAVAHFTIRRSTVWSAALIPVGTARIIIENTAHALPRRWATIAHELSHHLLEHTFDSILLADDGCTRFDQTK